MIILRWMLLILFVSISLAFAQETTSEFTSSKQFANAYQLFTAGKYQDTIKELNVIEADLAFKNAPKNEIGLARYWRGITYNRLQDYAEAIDSFKKSLDVGYSPLDLPYEYGQSLYAAERLEQARVQFSESFKRNYKKGVCLYYLGFISRELDDHKLAITYFKSIEELPEVERKDVQQPAEAQIGDIYLEQSERHPDAFRSIKEYVIPQYEKAMAVDKDSELAKKLNFKIREIMKKYELAVFNMQNGRPAPFPPYFLRFAQEISHDSNVTFSPQETTVESSKQSSILTKTEGQGRYTFFYKKAVSIAPEARISYTRYGRRDEDIYKNDSYLVAPSLRSAYEHTLFKKQASVLADYEYNYIGRDLYATEHMEFSSRSHVFMIGERFNVLPWGESVFRLKQNHTGSYTPEQNSKTNTVAAEQMLIFGQYVAILMANFDDKKMVTESLNTKSQLYRADLIFPKVRDWFTPSIYYAHTRNNPYNDLETRGIETKRQFGVKAAKTFGKFRVTLKYDNEQNESKAEDQFAYKKYIYGMDLEFIF